MVRKKAVLMRCLIVSDTTFVQQAVIFIDIPGYLFCYRIAYIPYIANFYSVCMAAVVPLCVVSPSAILIIFWDLVVWIIC